MPKISLQDAYEEYNTAAEILEEKRKQLLKIARELSELGLARRILNRLLNTAYI
jgi:hypothetical protein